jgi:hypothetical protein
VRGSSVLGIKLDRMIGQIREIVKDDSYSRHIHTVNGLQFGHANACSPAMSGVKNDQPCAPACVTLSQLSMIGPRHSGGGCTLGKQTPRLAAVASEIAHNLTNASQHVRAEDRDKPDLSTAILDETGELISAVPYRAATYNDPRMPLMYAIRTEGIDL